MSWNRPNSPAANRDKLAKSVFVRFAPLLILVLCVVGTLITCLRDKTESVIAHKTNVSSPKRLRAVSPNLSSNKLFTVQHTQVARRSNAGAKTYVDEKGVKRYDGGARVFERPLRKPINIAEGKPTFHNYAENQIYALISTNPGDTVFVTRKYDNRFVESFKKSLEEPIIPNNEDSEYECAAKQMMNEIKTDLAERMRKGENICEIMYETYSELQRLATVKRDVLQTARELIKNSGTISEEEANDILDAANKMLLEKGITPLSKNSLLTKNIQLNFAKGAENEN